MSFQQSFLFKFVLSPPIGSLIDRSPSSAGRENLEGAQRNFAMVKVMTVGKRPLLLKSADIALCGFTCMLIFTVCNQLHSLDPADYAHMLFAKTLSGTGDCDVSDFTSFYGAGALNYQRFSKDPALNVYDSDSVTLHVQRAVAPLHPLETYTIQYPPLFYWVLTPVAYLCLAQAWAVCGAMTVALLVLTFVLSARNQLGFFSEYAWGLVLVFLAMPSFAVLIIGQTSGWSAAAIAVTFELVRRQKFRTAAIPAALSLLKLQFFPIAFIVSVCLGKMRFLKAFIIAVIGAATVSGFVVGWQNLLNFVRANYLAEVTRTYTGLNDVYIMANLRGTIALITANNKIASLAGFAGEAGGCLAVTLMWLKLYPLLKKRSNYAFELCASITVLTLLFLAIHAFVYDYVLMIMPCIWLYTWARQGIRGARWLRVVILIMVPLTALLSWLGNFNTLPFWAALYVGHLTCQVLLLITLTAAIAAANHELKHGELQPQ